MSTEVKSAAAWQSPHGRHLPAPGGRTLIMGILNVTPDSFSDGGRLPTPQAVIDQAGALLAEGADVLDIGGESTRPGAAPLSAAEEMGRTLPAVEAVRQAFPDAPISVDTYKAAVAEAAVRAGADIINDVWGAAHELSAEQRQRWTAARRRSEALPVLPESPMAKTAAALGCPLILMHNRRDKNYGDFLSDVILDSRLSLALAHAAGVPAHQLWLDPGFGFAKKPAQNLEVLKNLHHLVVLGQPVLLGTSRKSTIGLVLDAAVHEREAGTGATLAWGIQQGCAMVRVHDVAAARPYVKMADAIKAGLNWTP